MSRNDLTSLVWFEAGQQGLKATADFSEPGPVSSWVLTQQKEESELSGKLVPGTSDEMAHVNLRRILCMCVYLLWLSQ